MKKMSEYLFLWAVGGCLYYTFEIVFRGFSHWTMFVLGGLCLVFCTAQGRAGKWRDPLGIQIIRCMIFVTSCEFITGIIVNKWLNLNVWALWTDLSAFHGFVRISLYDRYLFGWISAASSLWRRETADPDLVMSKEKKSKFSFFCPENSDIM